MGHNIPSFGPSLHSQLALTDHVRRAQSGFGAACTLKVSQMVRLKILHEQIGDLVILYLIIKKGGGVGAGRRENKEGRRRTLNGMGSFRSLHFQMQL